MYRDRGALQSVSYTHLDVYKRQTLGIIVEATLKLTRPLREPSVMVLGVPDLDSVMSLYHILRNKLELSAFEFFSERALRHVLKKGLHRPFDTCLLYTSRCV